MCYIKKSLHSNKKLFAYSKVVVCCNVNLSVATNTVALVNIIAQVPTNSTFYEDVNEISWFFVSLRFYKLNCFFEAIFAGGIL